VALDHPEPELLVERDRALHVGNEKERYEIDDRRHTLAKLTRP
jgi:hypothetical protein